MGRLHVMRKLTGVVAAAAAAALVFAGPASSAPTVGEDIDWNAAALQLRDIARESGNADALAAMNRLVEAPKQFAPQDFARQDAALPAQPFQIPAFSDTGRMDPASGQLYGSGIALGVDGFRFGFFGGPGTISPNQGGAKLEVIWLNLLSGRSGTEVLNEHLDVPVDTTIRTRALNPGGGPIVAAVYGSLWHRWSVPVSDQYPDGFKYVKSSIFWPSVGSVLG